MGGNKMEQSFEQMAKEGEQGKKIRLEVRPGDQAGTVFFEKPGALTFVVNSAGKVVIFVYDTPALTEHSEPIGGFDGTLTTNKNWEV